MQNSSSSISGGKLFLIVGVSGAGKDHLISAARQQWPGQLMVAHRYMTRCAASDSENNIALSDSEFEVRKQADLFILSWSSQDSSCGLGCEIPLWMDMGINVMVNGSNTRLQPLQELMGDRLIPVLVDVKDDVLKQRLRQRGSNSEAEIDQLLEKAENYRDRFSGDGLILDNSGSITKTLEQFGKMVFEPQASHLHTEEQY